jgi:multisubunit Na+/H+ antiporter MnhE subunit
MKRFINFVTFILSYIFFQYLPSGGRLLWKVLRGKQTQGVFIKFKFAGNHMKITYWFISLLISFTPGTLAVDFEKKELMVHLFDEDELESLINLVESYFKILA